MNRFILILTLCFNLSGLCQDKSSSAEISAALALVNQARKAASLEPVVISSALSTGCHNHARYLVANVGNPFISGMDAHKEFPELKEYSKEGELAARSAVIHYVKPEKAVEGWIKTFYHRVPLLQPNLKEIGIGFYESGGSKACVIDCISGLKGDSKIPVVVYPGENQLNTPLAMGPEIPDPVGKPGNYGFPITVFFANWQTVKNVTLTLTDNAGKVLACYLSSPDRPATYFSQWNSVCAIPQAPLIGGVKYTVKLNCTVNGKKYQRTWSFQTSKI